MRAVVLPAALAAVLLGAPASAGAAVRWSASERIAPTADTASVAIGARGRVLVVWSQQRERPGRGALLRAKWRTARGFGGALGVADVPSGSLAAPAIAWRADRALLAWQRGGGGQTLETTTLRTDGRRGAVTKLAAGRDPETAGRDLLSFTRGRGVGRLGLAEGGASGFTDPRRVAQADGDVAVDGKGTVYDAFVQTPSTGGRPRVFVATSTEDFAQPVALSGAGYPREAVVAANAEGAAVVAWTESDGGNKRVWTATKPAGTSAFEPARALATGPAHSLEAVATSGGEILVAWLAPRAGAPYARNPGRLRVAPVLSGGALRTVGTRKRITNYLLRADSTGGATAAWVPRVIGQQGGPVETAPLTASGRSGRTQRLTRRGVEALSLALATGPGGQAYAVWRRVQGETISLEGAGRPAG